MIRAPVPVVRNLSLWTLLHGDPHRDKMAYHETQKTAPPLRDIARSQRGVFAACGRCWVRTNVGEADGFTDRSLMRQRRNGAGQWLVPVDLDQTRSVLAAAELLSPGVHP
jgi:hypothetical protein